MCTKIWLLIQLPNNLPLKLKKTTKLAYIGHIASTILDHNKGQIAKIIKKMKLKYLYSNFAGSHFWLLLYCASYRGSKVQKSAQFMKTSHDSVVYRKPFMYLSILLTEHFPMAIMILVPGLALPRKNNDARAQLSVF